MKYLSEAGVCARFNRCLLYFIVFPPRRRLQSLINCALKNIFQAYEVSSDLICALYSPGKTIALISESSRIARLNL